MNEIVTINLYWDCECEHNYIHPSEQVMCFKCGVSKYEQPDSRLDEVMAQLYPHANKAISERPEVSE